MKKFTNELFTCELLNLSATGWLANYKLYKLFNILHQPYGDIIRFRFKIAF